VRLTRIEAQKKRPDRKNLYADGKFLAGVSAETLARLALRVGDEIGPDQLQAIRQTEELHSARSIALRYLASRPRTEKEIRNKLREKEFGDSEIASTIDDLRRSGLLNDLEFARAFLRDALTIRPAGAILLKRKLLLLGISREIVEQVFHESFSAEEQASLAREVARKYLRKTRALRKKDSAEKRRAKLTAFLVRKGFPWEIITEAISSAQADDE
jgi:regulatory protein